MSDNHRRYCAIKNALKSLRTTELKGNHQARHLDMLAMLITGVIETKKCELLGIAEKVPLQAKPISIVRRMERFLDNDRFFDDCCLRAGGVMGHEPSTFHRK